MFFYEHVFRGIILYNPLVGVVASFKVLMLLTQINDFFRANTISFNLLLCL